MASKYRPLLDRLAACPDDILTLPFTAIEAIVGRRLRSTARLDIRGQAVVFTRGAMPDPEG
jgi:hypothetical protein